MNQIILGTMLVYASIILLAVIVAGILNIAIRITHSNYPLLNNIEDRLYILVCHMFGVFIAALLIWAAIIGMYFGFYLLTKQGI